MSDTKINDRTPLTDKEIALELTRLQMEMVVAYAQPNCRTSTLTTYMRRYCRC